MRFLESLIFSCLVCRLLLISPSINSSVSSSINLGPVFFFQFCISGPAQVSYDLPQYLGQKYTVYISNTNQKLHWMDGSLVYLSVVKLIFWCINNFSSRARDSTSTTRFVCPSVGPLVR